MLWRSGDGVLEIEAPEALLESIRAEASLAMNGVGRGGVEVAGLLIGVRDGARAEIRDWRPIRCDHSLGASFQLSGRDAAALSAQLDGISLESRLSGADVVGWFVSHTRGELALRDEERSMHARFFPLHAELLLVLKPNQFGDVEADAYVMRGESALSVEGALHMEPKPGLHWQSQAIPGAATDETAVATGRSRPWAAFAGLAAIIAACGWMGWDLYQRIQPPAQAASPVKKARPTLVVERPPEMLAVHVRKGESLLAISWDAEAEFVRSARRGTLTVYDQGQTFSRALSADDLKLGRIDYTRQTSGITVSLVVEGDNGARRSERATFPSLVAPQP